MATLLRAAALIPGGDAPLEMPGRVLIRDGVIAATGSAAEQPADETLDLGETVLLPGFVNAHQHGRGLSQALLGYQDDRLEAWGNRRRKRWRMAGAAWCVVIRRRSGCCIEWKRWRIAVKTRRGRRRRRVRCPVWCRWPR